MKKTLVCIAAFIAAVVVGLIILPYLVDEPLRRYAERRLSSTLPGFSVHIRKLSTHPLALSLDLDGVAIIQKEHPEPPVVMLPRLHGGMRWSALLTARVVAEARADDPKITINMEHLRPIIEKMKEAPPSKEAWQDKLTKLPPFTVSEFRVMNGEVSYAQGAGSEVLSITRIAFVLQNLRNAHARAGDLPTQLFLEAVLPGSGRVIMNGSADLLQKPLLSIKADLELHGLNLAGLKDLARPFHIAMTKGLVEGTARIEMTPKRKAFILKDLTLNEPVIDYLFYEVPVPEEVKKEKKAEAAAKTKKLEREVVNKPGLLIMANRVRIMRGTLGLVNKSAKPEYRVFMNDLDLELGNFSNHFSEGPGTLFLKAQFMGSGDTAASGTFRPEKEGPDFDIRVAIKDTRMKAMNDLFRAYGNFDVSAGYFSFYSELTVVRNKVDGYVKPLFREIKVYDKRTDKEKGEFHKLYEKLIGGVAKLLENRPRKAVATETPVKGTLGTPKTNTWTALVNIVRNAFFQAILPGFEENIKK